MAWHQTGDKPLHETMLTYCQLDHWEQTLVKFELKYKNVSFMKMLSEKWPSFCPGGDELTLKVRGPSYLGFTRSISWLLMPWLLTLPGHQQPWYWLYVQHVGPGLTWGRISSTCVISMWSNDIKCEYMFMFPLKNLARKELTQHITKVVNGCYFIWQTW